MYATAPNPIRSASPPALPPARPPSVLCPCAALWMRTLPFMCVCYPVEAAAAHIEALFLRAAFTDHYVRGPNSARLNLLKGLSPICSKAQDRLTIKGLA